MFMTKKKKNQFIQHLSQIVRVLTEGDMGHTDARDAIAWLKEVLEYHAIAGKYQRDISVLITLQDWWNPESRMDADSLQ